MAFSFPARRDSFRDLSGVVDRADSAGFFPDPGKAGKAERTHGGDLPLNFHPAGTGALWVDTPIGAG